MQQNRAQKYYHPSTRQSGWFGEGPFSLRFPNISKSYLINSWFFIKIFLLIKWWISFRNEGIPKDKKKLEQSLPMVKPIFELSSSNKIRYTWIGHSTAVISVGEINFLIDPVFSQRSSPSQWFGPKRFRPPACKIQNLPKIDVVLVSHDHYDHLDQHSLNELEEKFKPRFIAGLNSKDVFPKGCLQKRMIQLDWTHNRHIDIRGKSFKVTFVPVAHWSRRGLFDHNKRLWGGFVLQIFERQQVIKKIFYSGDTGYCQIFKELKTVFGGFDLSILPIGAYYPRKFLQQQHIDPHEAIQVHLQIGSKKSVGVHWGTFPLGFERYDAARSELKSALKLKNLNEEQFITVDHGGSFQIDCYSSNQLRQEKQ